MAITFGCPFKVKEGMEVQRGNDSAADTVQGKEGREGSIFRLTETLIAK